MKIFDEEESKRFRFFQREKRQELQLIIERCNEVNFDYVCLPSVRNDRDLCFRSKTSRTIHLFADDKTVNSYVRKYFKEHFPEPAGGPELKKSQDESKGDVDVRPTHPFASKVPRFLDVTIDSTGVYRRKRKAREAPVAIKKIYSAFGSSSKRSFSMTKHPMKTDTPGVGVYNINKPDKSSYNHSFGGTITIKPAYKIICAPINPDNICEQCGDGPKNVYWKNLKTQVVLCRHCFNQRLIVLQTKPCGIVEKLHELETTKKDFEKKRYCSFYHQHNGTTAAVRLLASKDFRTRTHQENFLNSLFKY